MIELTEKQVKIITLARSWVGTPFVYQAAAKNIGADCSAMVKDIYKNMTTFNDTKDYKNYGLMPKFDIAIRLLNEFSTQVFEPLPADILLYKVRNTPHFAVLTEYGTIVHSHIKTKRYVEVNFHPNNLLHSIYRI